MIKDDVNILNLIDPDVRAEINQALEVMLLSVLSTKAVAKRQKEELPKAERIPVESMSNVLEKLSGMVMPFISIKLLQQSTRSPALKEYIRESILADPEAHGNNLKEALENINNFLDSTMGEVKQ